MLSVMKMISEKQMHILRNLYEQAKSLKVYTIEKTQEELAKELNITRQALSMHLKILKEKNLIRTGRGFIDLTDKALRIIGKAGEEAFVLIKVKPRHRESVFEMIKKMNVDRVYRVTGENDIIAVLEAKNLKDFLREVSKLDGIEKTSTYTVIEMFQR